MEPGGAEAVGRLGEAPVPSRRDGLQPRISRPHGRYFGNFFYSDGEEFTVEPTLFRSAHRIEYGEDGVRVEVTSTQQTLLYGPYVRIPRGRWRITVKVRVEGRLDESGEKHRLLLRIVKGIPARELTRVESDMLFPGVGEIAFAAEFETKTDIGLIETILAAQSPPLAGMGLWVSAVELARLP